MTARLFHGWMTANEGVLAGTVTDVANTKSFSVQGRLLLPFAARLWGSGSVVQYESAVDKLATQMLPAFTIPITVECRYDNLLNRVILQSNRTIDGVTFNPASQTAFGFEASYSNWNVITGSRAPHYVFTSTYGRARDTDLYEAESKTTELFADSGRVYSIGRIEPGLYRDWMITNESRANVFIDAQETLNSPNITYPWERFLKNIRKSSDIFVLFDLSNEDLQEKATIQYEDREAVYALTEQSFNLRPQMPKDDFGNLFNVNVKTRAYFPKHRDAKLFPPGSACQRPGNISAVYPENESFGVSASLDPTSGFLVFEIDYEDTDPSNPNRYDIFFGTNPALETPIFEDVPNGTTPVFVSSNGSGGSFLSASVSAFFPFSDNAVYYSKIVASNQCGSRTSEIFSFEAIGSEVNLERLDDISFSRASIATDKTNGIGFVDYFAEKYGNNELRRVTNKLFLASWSTGFPTANWYLFEGSRQNLIKQTENFDVSPWSRLGTASYLTGGFIDAFNSSSAWQIATSGSDTVSRVVQSANTQGATDEFLSCSFAVDVRGPETKDANVAGGEGVWAMSKDNPAFRPAGTGSFFLRNVLDTERVSFVNGITETVDIVDLRPSLGWSATGAGFGGLPAGDRDAIYASPQLELGCFPTSYIPNPSNDVATRQSDNFQARMPNQWHQEAGNIFMVHALPEYSSDEFIAETKRTGVTASHLIQIEDNLGIYLLNNAGNPDFRTSVGDSWNGIVGALSWERGDRLSLALDNSISEIRFYKNEVQQGAGGYTGGFSPVSGSDMMWIGSENGTDKHFNGALRFQLFLLS